MLIPSFKFSTLTIYLIISGLGSLAFSNASQAANLALNFSNWTPLGDVSLNPNQARITNAYADGFDDEINFNISGNNPLEAFDLEFILGLDDGTLGFNSGDTSAIIQTFTKPTEKTFIFKWKFLTNQTEFESNLNDYAFITINNQLFTLADTNSSFSTPGLYGFSRVTEGIFSYTFLPNVDYTIAIGVSDVGDYVTSSALLVQPIPEPLTLLGAGTALAFGAWFKRK